MSHRGEKPFNRKAPAEEAEPGPGGGRQHRDGSARGGQQRPRPGRTGGVRPAPGDARKFWGAFCSRGRGKAGFRSPGRRKFPPPASLSTPPPQPRLPPEGSRWPRGCARCGGGFPVLLRSCAPASPGVKRENKNKTKKKSKIDFAGFRHFGSGRIPPVRPCRAAPRQCKLGAFRPQKGSSQSSKKRSCWARGPASAPPVRGDFKARLRSDFSPYFRQCFSPYLRSDFSLLSGGVFASLKRCFSLL